MGVRLVAAVGLAVGGALAAVAPFLPWFRVTAEADDRSAVGSLAGTAYGTTTTGLGLLAIAVALLLLRPRPGWRWWPAIGAAAMFLVLVTGLRGALDPIGSGKAALSEADALDLAGVEPGTVEDLGFRIRLADEFNDRRLTAESLGAGWVAAPVSPSLDRLGTNPQAGGTFEPHTTRG